MIIALQLQTQLRGMITLQLLIAAEANTAAWDDQTPSAADSFCRHSSVG